jgi:hypothetical protein
MIYNILKDEYSESDSLPDSWKLIATERKYIHIKPPKIIDSIEGIYMIGISGGVVYLGETRHETVAPNGAQPGFDILATSEIIK